MSFEPHNGYGLCDRGLCVFVLLWFDVFVLCCMEETNPGYFKCSETISPKSMSPETQNPDMRTSDVYVCGCAVFGLCELDYILIMVSENTKCKHEKFKRKQAAASRRTRDRHGTYQVRRWARGNDGQHPSFEVCCWCACFVCSGWHTSMLI